MGMSAPTAPSDHGHPSERRVGGTLLSLDLKHAHARDRPPPTASHPSTIKASRVCLYVCARAHAVQQNSRCVFSLSLLFLYFQSKRPESVKVSKDILALASQSHAVTEACADITVYQRRARTFTLLFDTVVDAVLGGVRGGWCTWSPHLTRLPFQLHPNNLFHLPLKFTLFFFLLILLLLPIPLFFSLLLH